MWCEGACDGACVWCEDACVWWRGCEGVCIVVWGACVHMCVVWGCMCVWCESACSVRVYVCAHMNGCEVCACVTEKLVRY